MRETYQIKLAEKIKKLRENNENNLDNVKTVIKETAKEQLGYKDKKQRKVIDTSVEEMSKEQQNIRIKIENCSDPNKKK